MPLLSIDLMDFKFSKDMPMQPLGTMEASKAGREQGWQLKHQL